MTERPILFSGPMVRAILAGKKTQTRRVIKPQPPCQPEVGMYAPIGIDRHGEMYPKPETFGAWCDDWDAKCPYGQPGDVLWVKERWCRAWDHAHGFTDEVRYEATDGPAVLVDDDGFTLYTKRGVERSAYQNPLFMPRWASRLSLPLKSVRVERVQDISEADAMAEGCNPGNFTEQYSAVPVFADLWDSINGKTHPWASNPLVWVVEFEVQA